MQIIPVRFFIMFMLLFINISFLTLDTSNKA